MINTTQNTLIHPNLTQTRNTITRRDTTAQHTRRIKITIVRIPARFTNRQPLTIIVRNLTRSANRARLLRISRAHINDLDTLTPTSMLNSTLLIGKIPTRRTMRRRNPRQILHHQHIDAMSRQMPHNLLGY